MNLLKTTIAGAVAAASLFVGAPASALTITADYTGLNTVYQTPAGFLTNTALGNVDVTAAFKANVQTSIDYWQSAITLSGWNTTYNITLASLSGAVGDNSIQSHDNSGVNPGVDGRPNSNNLRVDSGNVRFFVDPTPWDNSEFTLAEQTITQGSSIVNSARYGPQIVGELPGHYDLLSLLLHEMEHGLGLASSAERWGTVVSGSTLTIDPSVSGLPGSFLVPIANSHIDGSVQSGAFNFTSIALPGWPSQTRALLTGVDILSICAVEGCTPSQINLNPTAMAPVPEPTTLALMVAGLGFVVTAARRKSKAGAK